MFRRFNAWRSMGKETFLKVPGQLVMRGGKKGVFSGARESKSYLCTTHLIQLYLKSETLKTPSLTQDIYILNGTPQRQSKWHQPAIPTTKHRVTNNMELHKVYKNPLKGQFWHNVLNRKKKITGIKLVLLYQGRFIQHPNHINQSLNLAEEAEGHLTGLGFCFVGFLLVWGFFPPWVFTFYLKKTQLFSLIKFISKLELQQGMNSSC